MSPLCQPPPSLVPSLVFPFRVDSSTRRNHSTSVTVGSVKVPAGYGAGTATIVLTAEMNPARTSTVTLALGA